MRARERIERAGQNWLSTYKWVKGYAKIPKARAIRQYDEEVGGIGMIWLLGRYILYIGDL